MDVSMLVISLVCSQANPLSNEELYLLENDEHFSLIEQVNQNIRNNNSEDFYINDDINVFNGSRRVACTNTNSTTEDSDVSNFISLYTYDYNGRLLINDMTGTSGLYFNTYLPYSNNYCSFVSININAFYYASLYYPDSYKSYNGLVLYNGWAVDYEFEDDQTDLIIPKGINGMAKYAYRNKEECHNKIFSSYKHINRIIIEDGVSNIPSGAFYGKNDCKTIIIKGSNHENIDYDYLRSDSITSFET